MAAIDTTAKVVATTNASDVYGEANRSEQQIAERGSREAIGAALPLEDEQGIMDSLTYALFHGGNRARSEILQFARDHNIMRVSEDLPDEIDGWKFLSELTGKPESEFERNKAAFDPDKPMSEFLRTMSLTGFVADNPMWTAGFVANEATEPLNWFFGGAAKMLGYGKQATKALFAKHDNKKVIFEAAARAEIDSFIKPYQEAVEKIQKPVTDAQASERAADILASGKTTEEIGDNFSRLSQLPEELRIFNTIQFEKATEIQKAAQSIVEKAGSVKVDKSIDGFKDLSHKLAQIATMDKQRVLAANRIGRAEREFSKSEIDDIVASQNMFLGRINKILNNGDASPDQIVRALASMKGPEETVKYVKALNNPGAVALYTELYVNSLLANMANIGGTNIISNFGMAAYMPLRKIMGGFTRENTFTDAGNYVYGMARSFQNAMRVGVKSTFTEHPSFLADKAVQAGTKAEFVHERAFTSSNRIFDTPFIQNHPWVKWGIDAVGRTARIPQALLLGTDEFFKGISGGAELEMLLMRKARQNNGLLSGRPAREVIDEVRYNPEEFVKYADEISSARKAGEYATFTNQPGPIGQGILSFANAHPSARLIIPFVRTPINITKFGFGELLGLKRFKDAFELARKGGDPQTYKKMATDLGMSSMSLGVLSMMASGEGENGLRITGPGTLDESARQFLDKNTDWKANSIQIDHDRDGVFETSIEYDRFDPFGMALSITAFMAEHQDYVGELITEDEWEELSVGASILMVQQFEDKAFFQGMTQFVDLLASAKDHEGSEFNKRVGSLLSRMAIVPGYVDGVESDIDPIRRDVSTLYNRIMGKIPGYSEGIPPEYSFFGRPLTNTGGIGSMLEDPKYRSFAYDLLFSTMPVVAGVKGVTSTELTREEFEVAMFMAKDLNYIPAPIPRIQEEVDEEDEVARRVKMTPEGYALLTKEAGQIMLPTLKRTIQELHQSEGMPLDPNDRRDWLNVEHNREIARTVMSSAVTAVNKAAQINIFQRAVEEKDKTRYFIPEDEPVRIRSDFRGITGKKSKLPTEDAPIEELIDELVER